MPNDFFQFKQFTIHQDKCAMKVCTDSCIFGASIFVGENVKNILDIGAGTGLLSLMLAQVSKAQIDAVEINQECCEQARQNILVSPWASRIRLISSSIQDFSASATKEYDLIVCNPPFYLDSLKSADKSRNEALHSSELRTEELIHIADKLLTENGIFWILLPPFEANQFAMLAKGHGFYIIYKKKVKDREDKQAIRTISAISKINDECSETSLIIKDKEGNYTPDFTKLLKPYYLHL